MATKKIGVLVGLERSWMNAFLAEVVNSTENVTADMVKLGGTRSTELCEYDVIIDRLSHQVPYYRTFLKAVALSGTKIINNPFWSGLADSFFNTVMLQQIGVQTPRSVALPTHSYEPHMSHDALGNLIYPIPWDDHIQYLGGFPIVLRPVWNNRITRMQVVRSYEELWRTYNETGLEPMLLQEHIAHERYVRCMCIGKQVLVTRYDPFAEWTHCYIEELNYVTKKDEKAIVDSALQIGQMLGYDMYSVDFSLRGKDVYVTDVISPLPDFDAQILPIAYFHWVVQTMVSYAASLTKQERKPITDFSWEMMAGLSDSTLANSKKRSTTTSKSMASSMAAKKTSSSKTKISSSSKATATSTASTAVKPVPAAAPTPAVKPVPAAAPTTTASASSTTDSVKKTSVTSSDSKKSSTSASAVASATSSTSTSAAASATSSAPKANTTDTTTKP